MNKLKILIVLATVSLLTTAVVFACITKDLSHSACSDTIEARLCAHSEIAEDWMKLCLDINNAEVGCMDIPEASTDKLCTGTHTCGGVTKKVCGKPKAGKT